MEHFLHVIVLPSRIRVDRGTETGVMCTIHSYLRAQQHKIERWWRKLSHRMEGYFKDQLKSLLEDGDCDPSNETDRYALQTKMHLITCTQGLGGLGGC